MDKSTLSNYGWIVIAVLVLSVMIALATPFGQYVEQGVRATTEGLFSTSQNAMNSAFGDLGVEVKDQTFEEGYTGVKEVQLDTLRIYDEEYTFEVGMTWEEWVNSEYNIGGYINDGTIVIKLEEEWYRVSYGTPFIIKNSQGDGFWLPVAANQEIVKDEIYWLQRTAEIGMMGGLSAGDKYFDSADNDGKIIYNQIRYTYGEN